MSVKRTKPSGAMADIIAQGQQNVTRLEATFSSAPVTEVPTDYLIENRSNPRKHISEASVRSMINGIQQANGKILQPLLIRPIPMTDEGARYEIVCGGRRIRAARRLEMKSVPVRVEDLDDETVARFALWENLSREDLSPMDLAESIDDLRKIDHLSWDEIGERFGFTRQWGWQQQKLAELPEQIRNLVREEELSVSNAFAIATSDFTERDKIALAQRVVKEKITYRSLLTIIKCKDVFTSLTSSTEKDICKDVFTWEPPSTMRGRRFARLTRATEEVVASYNQGQLTREYAESLRSMAENIIRIADGEVDPSDLTLIEGGRPTRGK